MNKKKDNKKLFEQLREKHSAFHFLSSDIEMNKDKICISNNFSMENGPSFTAQMSIEYTPLLDEKKLIRIPNLKQFAFHIGMVELISYWKTACPPDVFIHAGFLTPEQLLFWKKLYFNGLGEFFYLNNIDASENDFLHLHMRTKEGNQSKNDNYLLNSSAVLVPVGGGKDSIVSLELLQNSNFTVIPFALNPTPAIRSSIKNAGISEENCIFFKRSLDKEMLDLNSQGYLNGHTPFSSLLAFSTLFASQWSGAKYIALSNEASANEATIPGTKINHQYSKSIEFENDFRNYLKNTLGLASNYFSFLRPLNELQIGALLSRFKQHHTDFRSCNVGSKQNKWCGNCPKCLFTWTILSPFIEKNSLIRIFGKDLSKDKNLLGILQQLAGEADEKPFECVGTMSEVQAAIHWINKHQSEEDNIFHSIQTKQSDTLKQFLNEWNPEHNLEDAFEHCLKSHLKKYSVHD